MYWSSFFFALITTALAVAFIGLDHEIWALVLAPAAAWFAFLTFALDEAEEWKYVLTLGGVRWTEADFCRGWEIDGRTGSGKTASGVVPIIHALKINRPDMGILALDTKGDLERALDGNCRGIRPGVGHPAIGSPARQRASRLATILYDQHSG